jgi:two-component system response regulator FixJ
VAYVPSGIAVLVDMNSREIFILEDDLTVRQMMSVVLGKAGYVPICFADGNALLVCARQKYPICILLDIVLPGRSGMEVLRELQKERYSVPIVMVSGHGSMQAAVQAGRMGAVGFIEKPFKGSDLIRGIEEAIANRVGIPEQQGCAIGPKIFSGLTPFTRREQQVVDQMLLGKSTKDIAILLELSPRTVEDHRSNILRKANVRTTAQLVARILTSGQDSNGQGNQSGRW